MNLDNKQTHDYYLWKSKMPPYPESNTLGGGKVALTPKIAAKVLTEIARGANPREAFIQEGISERTYARYQKRSGPENEIGRYIAQYFELQTAAQEVARDEQAKARLELQKPAPSQNVTQTRVSKTRKVVLNVKVVRLRDVVTTTTIHYTESRPLQHFISDNQF